MCVGNKPFAVCKISHYGYRRKVKKKKELIECVTNCSTVY